MAGEIVKTEAVCLGIRPWSRTSHVVTWLTPHGRITTLVKGAVRPKSAFLGQYDLNYTCEMLYYARAKGELHALRECCPLNRRDALRDDWRALALAEYFRRLAADLAPNGPECETWYDHLVQALDDLEGGREVPVAAMLAFERDTLELCGLLPDFSGATTPYGIFYVDTGSFSREGTRKMPVSPEVARCLTNSHGEIDQKILVDAARVFGVFYTFHLDCASDVRRTVLGMILKQT